MRGFAVFLIALAPAVTVLADQVTITGGTVYVTRSDCQQLVRHHPAPDVAYQPGTDVHGKYVAPADLPGSDAGKLVPDSLHFDVTVNPMAYAGRAAGTAVGPQAGQAGKYPNTAAAVAHVDVDLASGETSLNGKPLNGPQEKALLEACRKAGIR